MSGAGSYEGAGFWDFLNKAKDTWTEARNRIDSTIDAAKAGLREGRNRIDAGIDQAKAGLQEGVNRVGNFMQGARIGYSPSAARTLEEFGDWTVTGLSVRRTPVGSPLTSAINAASLGTFNKAREEEGVQTLYHLGLACKLVSPDHQRVVTVLAEKNAVINLSQVGDSGDEQMPVAVPQRSPPLTFRDLMEKARAAQGDSTFFSYAAFTNNCQDFVRNLLRSSGLLTPESDTFIKQSIDAVQQKSASHTTAAANFVTDLGARVDRLVQGGALTGGMLTLAEYRRRRRALEAQIDSLRRKIADVSHVLSDVSSYSHDDVLNASDVYTTCRNQILDACRAIDELGLEPGGQPHVRIEGYDGHAAGHKRGRSPPPHGGALTGAGTIYEISSRKGNVRYIGSTTEPLDRRLARHLSMFKSYKAGTGPYVHSFKVLRHGDAVIRPYRSVPGASTRRLERVEGDIQRRLRRANGRRLVNRNIAGGDRS